MTDDCRCELELTSGSHRDVTVCCMCVFAGDTLAAADSSSTGAKQNVQQQVQEIFKELKADAPHATILSAHGL